MHRSGAAWSRTSLRSEADASAGAGSRVTVFTSRYGPGGGALCSSLGDTAIARRAQPAGASHQAGGCAMCSNSD